MHTNVQNQDEITLAAFLISLPFTWPQQCKKANNKLLAWTEIPKVCITTP
jgi:hypothetical protein